MTLQSIASELRRLAESDLKRWGELHQKCDYAGHLLASAIDGGAFAGDQFLEFRHTVAAAMDRRLLGQGKDEIWSPGWYAFNLGAKAIREALSLSRHVNDRSHADKWDQDA